MDQANYGDNVHTLLGQIKERRVPFTRADAEAIDAPTLVAVESKIEKKSGERIWTSSRFLRPHRELLGSYSRALELLFTRL